MQQENQAIKARLSIFAVQAARASLTKPRINSQGGETMVKISLNPHAFGLAAAIVTLLVELFGYLWHGMMGQPSMMSFMYPGFWGNSVMMLTALAASVVF